MQRFLKRLIAALAVIVLGASRLAMADITYQLQNYPDQQNGAKLSGYITTDGTIGDLLPNNIISWSWTVTPIGDSAFTLSSSDVGANIILGGSVVASANEIDMNVWDNIYVNRFQLSGSVGNLSYARTVLSFYSGQGTSNYWSTSPNLGTSEPWVIAVATAVPEPSSVWMLSIATVGLAGLVRRARQTRAAQ